MALFTDGKLTFSEDTDWRFAIDMSEVGPGHYSIYYEEYDEAEKRWIQRGGVEAMPTKLFKIAALAAETLEKFDAEAKKIYGS